MTGPASTLPVRVVLPHHLQVLARCEREVTLDVAAPATARGVVDALEARFPMLSGTVREHVTLERRPRVRFFAGGADISHDPDDRPLPDAVAGGREPFIIIGAVSGG